MARRATFRQSDMARAYRAAADAGTPVSKTEIMPDGRIVIYHDEVIKTEALSPFEQWKAERNAHAS